MINLYQPSLGKEELNAIEEVFRSNWLGKGPKTEEFIKQFASRLTTANMEGVGFSQAGTNNLLTISSCTEGLFQSVDLYVNEGDEVILPSISFIRSQNILSILSGQQILIVDLEDQDNYGIYGAGTLTQDANETNFFNLDLSTPTKFNGSFTNKKFYAIISIGGGGSDKHAVLSFDATNFATTTDQQGNVTLLEEAINGSTMKYVNWRHDLSKRPSITVAESGSPEQIAHVPIKYIDDNNVRVYFNGTTGGKIYAN